jgi:hypothetical protein
MHASKFVFLAVSGVLFAGCASHDGPAGNEPDIDETAQLRATIASVELLEDCPDPEPASEEREAAKSSELQSTRRAACEQSTLQLALAHDATQAQLVDVVAVRLLRAETKQSLTTLSARKPSKWDGNGVYQEWDRVVPVGNTIEVSYRLAAPDWNVVQEKLSPGNTYGERYLVEVDLAMAGAITTVRSTEIARLQPDLVET